MRTFEKILIGVLGAIDLLNLLPVGWEAGWLNFTLLNLLALMLVLHLAIERSRWQMGPLYILTLVTLAVMFGRQANPGLWATSWAGVGGLGLLALFSLLPACWSRRTRPSHR
jgi:hypothetical protein